MLFSLQKSWNFGQTFSTWMNFKSFNFFSTFSFDMSHKINKHRKAFDFCSIKYIHVILEKSSTNKRKHLLSPWDGFWVSLQMSTWTSSSGIQALQQFWFILILAIVTLYFLSTILHSSSSKLMYQISFFIVIVWH